MIDAVLFDLDGTLLDIDIDRLLPPYTEMLADTFKDYISPESFSKELMIAVMAMVENVNPAKTNKDVFWETLQSRTGVKREAVSDITDAFYAEQFPRLQSVATRVPIAEEVVNHIAERVDKVVLATNPIFPGRAICERLRWAGIDPEVFSLITTYETMHASKPNPEYYEEICEKIGVRPDRCVMIGNDPRLDIDPASQLGMKTYFVNDVTAPGKTEQAFAKVGPAGKAEAPGDAQDRHREGPLKEAVTFVAQWIIR